MPIHPDCRPIASFASKAVIHPSYIPRESKAVIHPSYRPKDETTSFGSQECGAGGDSNDVVSQARRYSMGELRSDHLGAVTAGVERDNLTDAGLGNNSAYVDEDVDGYMKFGDIKAEFAGVSPNSWRDVRDHNYGKVINGPLYQLDALPDFSLTLHEQNPNSMHEQNPNSIHDNLHGNRTNWDVICDVGTFIKQTSVADALKNLCNGAARLTGIETGSGDDHITTGLGENNVTNAATYRLKDVIITSFDNSDALTNGGSTPLQENYADGNWLNKGQQGEGFVINDGSIAQH